MSGRWSFGGVPGRVSRGCPDSPGDWEVMEDRDQQDEQAASAALEEGPGTLGHTTFKACEGCLCV